MVDFTVNIPSKVARNRAAQTILKFMQVLNPQVRELDDYMHKLYDQLIIMSDYKLDIDNPYPAPVKEEEVKKNHIFQYKSASIRFRRDVSARLYRMAKLVSNKDLLYHCTNLVFSSSRYS